MPYRVGTRDSFMEPSFPSTQKDPLRNYPIGHPSALINYYLTRDVLVKGDARNRTVRTHNDVNFALQRDISKGQYSEGRRRPFDLVTMDFVNVRDLSTPTATSGRFTTSLNSAGTFVPVGTHAEPSASPSLLGFSTEAAQQRDIVVCGLFRIDELDTDGIVGVYALGTAATDHWRVEVRTSGTQAHVVTRDGSTDTSDADTDVVGDVPDDEVSYISIGARINDDETFIMVVNGEVVLSGTLSSDAQAHTGNIVGVRCSGAAPGTGVLLFQALDLKVNS